MVQTIVGNDFIDAPALFPRKIYMVKIGHQYTCPGGGRNGYKTLRERNWTGCMFPSKTYATPEGKKDKGK
jgi:hypothetical protein